MEGKDAITTEDILLLNLTTQDVDGFLQGFPGKNSPYTVTQMENANAVAIPADQNHQLCIKTHKNGYKKKSEFPYQ